MVKNDPKITKIGKIENRRKKRKIMHMFERILMIIISLYIYKTILGILVLSSVVEHLWNGQITQNWLFLGYLDLVVDLSAFTFALMPEFSLILQKHDTWLAAGTHHLYRDP